jgi:hypothetical protein
MAEADLGWDAMSLFGCDRQRPLDRPGAGLLWRVGAGRVIAIRKDWAAIETNGVQHIRPWASQRIEHRAALAAAASDSVGL